MMLEGLYYSEILSNIGRATLGPKERITAKYYIKVQFVPDRKHIMSPLQRPTG
jgi:hypothetical protein